MPVDPSLTPELIEAQAFSTGFRGYDQSEVRKFLGRVAAEVRSYRERTERLESAWRSAEERAARPPVLDEDTLMAAVGDETATILRGARAAAADVRTRAAADAERVVAAAEAQAAQIRADAEGVMGRELAAAEEASSRIVESAKSEAAETMEKARTDADAIRASAQQEKTLTVEGAIATRERVLEDLSRRRRVASVQIEQLRAGRERLLESYAVVRRTLEEVNDDLNRADAEARAAADEVGRRMHREQPAEPASAPPGEQDSEAIAVEAEVTVNGGVEASEPPPPPPPDAAPSAPTVQASSPPARAAMKRPGRVGVPGATASGAATATATATAPVQPDPGGSPAPVDRPEQAGGVPHLRVVPDAGEGSTSGLGSKVDMLFARIRAGRVEKEPRPAPAVGVVAEAPEAASPETASPEAGSPETAGPDEAEVVSAEAPEPNPEDSGLEAPRLDGDEGLLQRREAALTDIEAALTRKLKRTLQDEQNDLLDRLRSLPDEPTAARLLPEPADHVERYAGAAQPFVEQSAGAGVAFAAEIVAGDAAAYPGSPAVSDLSEEAAATIVESLRRRLEHALSSAAGDEQGVLMEALGAAYREWKSERIERIAGDVLAAAFARGTWQAVPEGTPLRWIVDDTDGPCPDCDDDALAGGLPKGEAFPTGQLYPPAHPGCRCLLVPVTG
jgi:DivIVA domain-containing protein